MADYDATADLAARDIVARAIASEIAAGRGAFLDARAAVGAAFPQHFPTVFAACMAARVDPRLSPIPVAPAAHYHMGGVATDLWGKTSAPGLSAIGECASTGAHGANRLASNSLLESMVFAHRVGERLREDSPQSAADVGAIAAPPAAPADITASLRALMSANVGVVRDGVGLRHACDLLDDWLASHGAANALLAARIIADAALAREESRGAHTRTDHPDSACVAKRSFILPDPNDLV
jgi:L-aspartate oxidase